MRGLCGRGTVKPSPSSPVQRHRYRSLFLGLGFAGQQPIAGATMGHI